MSDSGKEFMTKILEAEPAKRFSAADALKHPWLNKRSANTSKPSMLSLKNIQKLQGNNKMKTAVLNFISVNQISMETREKYEHVFLEMDID